MNTSNSKPNLIIWKIFKVNEYFKVKKEPDVDREDLIIRRNRKKVLVKTDPEREAKIKKIANDLTGKKNKKEIKELKKEKAKLGMKKDTDIDFGEIKYFSSLPSNTAHTWVWPREYSRAL